MKSISNPIQSKVEWDKMRSEAESEPGAFHGKIAKSEIFWIEKGHNAWIRWSETEKKWIGYDRLTGKNVDVGNLSESFDPWSQSFDDSSAPVYRWFKGGMTNAAFNEIDRHVLAGSHESIAVIFEGEAWDEKQNSDRGGPVVTRRISYGELLTQVVRYAVVLRDLGIKRGQRIALNMSNTCEQLFSLKLQSAWGLFTLPYLVDLVPRSWRIDWRIPQLNW